MFVFVVMETTSEKTKKRRLGRADESENMHSMKEGVQLFIKPVLSTRARSMLTF
jgi:hypothetical protein